MEIELFALFLASLSLGLSIYVLVGKAGSKAVSKVICKEDEHIWADRPYLISGDEAVFICKNGCGKTLRQKRQENA